MQIQGTLDLIACKLTAFRASSTKIEILKTRNDLRWLVDLCCRLVGLARLNMNNSANIGATQPPNRPKPNLVNMVL